MGDGTLAVVTHLYDNCIIIQKLANPSQRYPIPRFRQKITFPGASYSIMRQQFPLQLAYGVTVHRVQGLCIKQLFASMRNTLSQAKHMLHLVCVRKLEDLVLWDFDPSAIHVFLLQLISLEPQNH